MRKLLLASLVFASADAATPPPGGSVHGKLAVVKQGKRIAKDAWVYLKPKKRARKAPSAATTVEIRQVNTEFAPHVVVVAVGSTVTFTNYDSDEHNVFSSNDPGGQWDLGRYYTDHKGRPRVFQDDGEVDIYCDKHFEMWAKVKVVESAYIATVTNGSYAFTGVAAGTYKVIAWSPDSKETESADWITITDGSDSVVGEELHIEAGERPRTHLRKDGTPYTTIYKPP